MWAVKGVVLSECRRMAKEQVSDRDKRGGIVPISVYRQRIEDKAREIFERISPRMISPKYANKREAILFKNMVEKNGNCRNVNVVSVGK